jgi:hypothetical protein
MLGVDGAEHRLAFVRLVDAVFLGDAHRRERCVVVRIEQRDLVALRNAVRRRRIHGQRDRDRPEQARRGLETVAHALPVGARHEALERREAADAEHDEVALFARGDAQPRERPGAAGFGGALRLVQQQRAQAAAAVREWKSHG